MGRRDEDIPKLEALGLKIFHIQGDGNCLFRSLSDQLYGNVDKHAEIRAKVVEHMRTNAEHFKPFVTVNVGGGTRRNPKRRGIGAAPGPLESSSPSAEAIDVAFEVYLQDMAKNATWGDNYEISAFAQAYNVNVMVYQDEFDYAVSPLGECTNDLPTVSIAYYTWRHFNSVHKVDGLHTGLPQIGVNASTTITELATAATAGDVPSWQVDIVEHTLKGSSDAAAIKRAITEANGNLGEAVGKLTDNLSSGPSSPQESDSDGANHGPNKRNQRLVKRATHDLIKARRALAIAEHYSGDNTSSDSVNTTAAQVASSVTSSSPDPTPAASSTNNSERVTDTEGFATEDEPMTGTEDEKKRTVARKGGSTRLKINPSKVTKPSVRVQDNSTRRRLMSRREFNERKARKEIEESQLPIRVINA